MKGIIFNKYRIDLTILGEGFISDFAGSMMRGSLFSALRSLVCLTKSETCKGCIVWDQCSYSFFFDSPSVKVDSVIKAGDSIPHPYIIEMPFPHRHYIEKGKTINFNIVLIGKSIVFLPHLICAILRMCEKGIGRDKIILQLDSVSLEKEGGESMKIFENNKLIEHKVVYKANNFFQDEKDASKITLRFETPVRIKHRGRLCTRLEFDILIKNILRRISLLSIYYGDEEAGDIPDFDIQRLIKRAASVRVSRCRMGWVDIGRYSSAQKMEMQLGGIKGRISFEGDLREFIPFIKLAEILHIGKNTSFGLGKYTIESIV